MILVLRLKVVLVEEQVLNYQSPVVPKSRDSNMKPIIRVPQTLNKIVFNRPFLLNSINKNESPKPIIAIYSSNIP